MGCMSGPGRPGRLRHHRCVWAGVAPGLGGPIGAPADVSVLELAEGAVDFVDTRKNARKGSRYLKAVATVRAGRPFGRPYPSPFSYP